MHIFHEQDGFFPWELEFPINYLIVDFHFDDDVYGDILIFESVYYTGEYLGPDSVYEHQFFFWQNAVRVEAPTEEAKVTIQLFEDEALTQSATTLFRENDEFYTKITINNPNDKPLKDVVFSNNLPLYNVQVKNENGDSVVPTIGALTAFDTLNLSLEGGQSIVIVAKLENNEPSFNGDLLEVIANVKTTLPPAYLLDLDNENILGTEAYVVLKTEEQMADEDFQAAFTNDPDQNWQEGDPYKTSFEYGLTLPQDKTDAATIEDSDKAAVTLAANGANVTIRYVDEVGADLSNPIVLEGKIGQEYTSAAIIIDGYTLSQTPDNNVGVFTENEQEVIYIYAKDKAPIKPDTPDLPGGDVGGATPPTLDNKAPIVPVDKGGNTNSLIKPEKGSDAIMPRTGERISFWPLGLGLIILAAGLVYMLIKRKMKDNK